MLWSSVRIAGTPLPDALRMRDRHRSVDHLRERVEHDVRFANITIIEGNDASQYGIGVVCARIAEAVLGDERVVMPVAAHQAHYGATIALPTIVGCEGAEGSFEPSMSGEERRAFEHSAETLRDAARGIGAG
jgi:L-lactate dehydrogenase